MGFFLKDQIAVKEPFVPVPAGIPRRFFFSLLVIGTIASVIAGGGVFLFKKAWRNVATREDFKVDPSTLEIRGLPDWVSPKIAGEIKKCSSLRGEFSIFEPRVAERIAQEFLKSPWVSSVKYIKKEFPNRISMQFEIRRPVAMAKSNGKSYMLDADGVVLSPRLYQWPKDFPAEPAIVPNPSVQMPEPGARCDDAGVQAGIDLLIFLLENRADRFLRLAAIDVTNVGGRLSPKEPEIILWTEGLVRIKWGRAPNQSNCGEVPAKDKLANLNAVLRSEGRNFSQLEYADIRWDKAYVKYKGG